MTRKLSLFTIFMVVMAMVFSGCRQEEDDTPTITRKPMDLKITSFNFKASDNSILGGNNAIGTIEGDTIRIDCPKVTSIVSLVPEFQGTYKEIFLNGKPIESGVTKADWSKANELVLKGYTDKERRVYKVQVRYLNLIPRIAITTPGEITSRTEYQPATITISNSADGNNFTASGKARGRGNATFLSYPKKSYRFKLDEAASVCGFQKNRDWVLLAEYCDKSLMRTTYMNALGRAAGCEWTPKSTHVDLYLNGKYNGTYLLIEQVERAKHKIVMEDDGFMIEDDNYYSWEPLYFTTSIYGRPYTFKYPDAGDGDIVKHDANYDYIKNFMNTMETTLRSSSFKDPEKGYRKYLDVPSFVSWYLVMELLGDHDPNFFYVLPTRGAKLKMYPVWDAEWTLGLASAGPNGWQNYPEKPIYTETSEMYRTRRYFDMLFKDPYFVEQVYLAWGKLKKNLDQVRSEVAAEIELTKLSQEDNFKTWNILGQPVSVGLVFFKTWKEELKYESDWFEKRIVWFDSYIEDLYQKSR